MNKSLVHFHTPHHSRNSERLVRTLTADAAVFAGQFTDQYRRAVGGMVEVLKFGAMMMLLERALSTREDRKALRGRNSKGEGVKGWLEEHAPDVNRQTAYRFKNVAEAIAEEAYVSVVGVKIAREWDLPLLIFTPDAELPEAAKAKQLELFEFVQGTSQRSWLDQMRPPRGRGGNTYVRENGKGQRQPATEEDTTATHAFILEQAEGSLRHAIEAESYMFVHREANALEQVCREFIAARKEFLTLRGAEREDRIFKARPRYSYELKRLRQ